MSAEIFGYANPDDAAIRARPRHRVPAHQHHSRRRRGRAPRPDLPAAGRARAPRRHRDRRSSSTRSRSDGSRADGRAGGARAPVVRSARSTRCRRRIAGRSARASSWRRSTARCWTRSSATAIACSTSASRSRRCASSGSPGRPRAVTDAAPARVAVVGGGWAGCAAAVTLARRRPAGHAVRDRRRTLGGRARRVVQRRHRARQRPAPAARRVPADACASAAVHRPEDADRLFHRLPLTLRPSWPASAGRFRARRVECARRRSTCAAGLLSARGLSWGERAGADRRVPEPQRSRDFSRGADETVAQRFAATPPRAFAAVWAPLCLAALNTPPDRASAQVFAHVLRAAFARQRRATATSSFPAADLVGVFPDAAARYIAARGGIVRCGAPCARSTSVTAASHSGLGGDADTFAAAIVAVGPHQLATTVGDAAAGSDHVARSARARRRLHLRIDHDDLPRLLRPQCRSAAPMLRLDDAPGQWAFDRERGAGEAGAPTRRDEPDRGGHQRRAVRMTRWTTRRSPRRRIAAAAAGARTSPRSRSRK